MKGLLKFITCGSVDDGKSTLIGHILYDAKLIYADQERALELDSKAGSRNGRIDYSLLLDGLMEEREQGITIDVAYRYFTTNERSFIVADTPGHEEYTRNMAVGASFADLAVILADASQGVLVQTRRHARICALMGIRYFVFAVNKMDLVGYSRGRFDEIERQIRALSEELELPCVQVIPVSATEGDNVTKRSERMRWYEGPVLLSYLETVDVSREENEKGFYLPVQRVCRPDHTFRGFQGQAEGASVQVGDPVEILPSGEKAHIKEILVGDQAVRSASAGMPVTIQLDREVDVSRGSVISAGSGAKVISALDATLLWMDEEPGSNGKNVFVKLGTSLIPGTVTKIISVTDVNTGEQHAAGTLQKNEIALCTVTLSDRIVADTFSAHPMLGELILIDRVTFHTTACGVVRAVREADDRRDGSVAVEYLRCSVKGQQPLTALFVPGRDPVTRETAVRVERLLTQQGRHTYLYEPAADEDFRTVVHHLRRAGLITLLVLTPQAAAGVDPAQLCFLSGWKEGMEAEEIAAVIRKKSSFLAFEASRGDYI